jgi:hypothetical protein
MSTHVTVDDTDPPAEDAGAAAAVGVAAGAAAANAGAAAADAEAAQAEAEQARQAATAAAVAAATQSGVDEATAAEIAERTVQRKFAERDAARAVDAALEPPDPAPAPAAPTEDTPPGSVKKRVEHKKRTLRERFEGIGGGDDDD